MRVTVALGAVLRYGARHDQQAKAEEETEGRKAMRTNRLFQFELNAMVRIEHGAAPCRFFILRVAVGSWRTEADAVKLALVAADTEYHAGKPQAAVNRLSVLARQLSGKQNLKEARLLATLERQEMAVLRRPPRRMLFGAR